MIEHLMRALFPRQLASFVTARGPEHAQTASARCTAAVPTPPLAPCTRTVSPGLASARWNNPRYAVAYGVPIAAPCTKEAFAGNPCTCPALHNANSAYVPLNDPAV